MESKKHKKQHSLAQDDRVEESAWLKLTEGNQDTAGTEDDPQEPKGAARRSGDCVGPRGRKESHKRPVKKEKAAEVTDRTRMQS